MKTLDLQGILASQNEDLDQAPPPVRGKAYQFLSDLRARGITVRADGATLVNGRLVGGDLLVRPSARLTDLDRATLKRYAPEIRHILPLMLTGESCDRLVQEWEE